MPAGIAAIGQAVAAWAVKEGIVGTYAAAQAIYYGTQAVIYGGIAFGSTAASNALNKPSSSRSGSPTFGNDRIYNTESTLYPIPIVYGRVKVGGNIIRRYVYGGDSKLVMVIGLCSGEIESIENPELNDDSWDEMTKGVGFDEVSKYYGTLTQTPNDSFMANSVTGSWADSVFTRSSGREFNANDENSFFIADDYYKISSYDSASQITCDRNGSGTTGYVDRSKKLAAKTAKTVGSWAGNVFTRSSGRRFKITDQDGWFETANGEWQITDVDADAQTITCSGSSHAGTEGRFDEAGYSQAYRGIAYIVVELKATAKLGGNPTVTTVIEGKKCTPLVGGAKVYSRNPAVAIYDFLTDVVGIDSGDIDVASFQIVEAYCDALVDSVPRYTLDMVIDSQRPIVDILQDMLSAFCGALIYSENKIKLIVEKTEASSAYEFDEDNIVENSFSFWRPPERVNQVKITFPDEDNNYRYETIVAKNKEDIALYGVIEKEISASFITRKCQASRLVQMLLDKSMAAEFYCQITGSYGSSVVEPMDKVTVTHAWPDWTAKEFRVINIERQEDGRNTFLLESYDASIYHDTGVGDQPTWHRPTPPPDSELEQVENLTATERWTINADGTLVPYVEVTFDAMDELLFWAGCRIDYRINSGGGYGTWIEGTVNTTGIDHRIYGVIVGDTVQVRAVVINWRGGIYDIDNASTDDVIIGGKTASDYPANVTSGGYTFSNNTLKLYWTGIDVSSDKDFMAYEVRDENANWGTRDSHQIYFGSATFVTLNNITSSSPGPYYVKAVNTSRVYSQTAYTITPSNSAPAQVGVITVTSKISGVLFEWPASTDALHKDYYVKVKIGSGGSWSEIYQNATSYFQFLGTGDASGETVYIEVKDRNTLNQTSASARTADGAAQALPATDFKASDLDIPLYKFDSTNTFTGDSTGIKWDAFYCYYQGKKITINAHAYITDAYVYTPDLSAVADGGAIDLIHTNTDATFATAMKAKHQWPVFLYDPDLDTAWLVPGNKMMFVGFLKVNNLAAISANLGTVTAGTMTGIDGTFTNLIAQATMTVGELNADGSGATIINETIGSKKCPVFRSKAIDSGEYYILKIYEGAMLLYQNTGSWPDETAFYQKVRINAAGVQGIGMYGGTDGSDWLLELNETGGNLGTDASTKITVNSSGVVATPAAALTGTLDFARLPFVAKNYTGDGAAGTQDVTHAFGFTPDFVWIINKTGGNSANSAAFMWLGTDTSLITSVGGSTFTVTGILNTLNDLYTAWGFGNA